MFLEDASGRCFLKMHQEATLHTGVSWVFLEYPQVFLEDASGGDITRTMALRPASSQLQGPCHGTMHRLHALWGRDVFVPQRGAQTPQASKAVL